jgi:hypothetical protein
MTYDNRTIIFDYSLLLPNKQLLINITKELASNAYIKNITHYIQSIKYTKINSEIIMVMFVWLFILLTFYILFNSFRMQLTESANDYTRRHTISSPPNTPPNTPTNTPTKTSIKIDLEKLNKTLADKNKDLYHKNKVLVCENKFLCEIIADIRIILDQDERSARKNTKIINLLKKYYDEDDDSDEDKSLL